MPHSRASRVRSCSIPPPSLCSLSLFSSRDYLIIGPNRRTLMKTDNIQQCCHDGLRRPCATRPWSIRGNTTINGIIVHYHYSLSLPFFLSLSRSLTPGFKTHTCIIYNAQIHTQRNTYTHAHAHTHTNTRTHTCTHTHRSSVNGSVIVRQAVGYNKGNAVKERPI